jgi:MOSC domain-containing protein YiiM
MEYVSLFDLTSTSKVILLFLSAVTVTFTTTHLFIHRRPIPTVVSVSSSPSHHFTKQPVASINLLTGLGVEGDAHMGVHVQHLSRIKPHNPDKNLRQVHLIHNEILQAHDLQPADIGENITTSGIKLLSLGKDTELRFVHKGLERNAEAVSSAPCVVITGLRNPCHQIDKFRKGLQEKFVERDEARKIKVRKAGVMSVVRKGGTVEAGMSIVVQAPQEFISLDVV